MELLFLALFAASLIACVVTGASVVFALIFGYILFFSYGLIHGKSVKEMLRFSRNGIFTVKNVLLTLLLISMLTAIWRACGSIAYIVYYASAICTPSVMLLASFLLCCLISFLTGTSFGSAATIGVICMTMANSMGIPPFLTGGAILAGACLLFQKPLLGVLGANEALMRDCIAYGTIMLAGAPIFLLQTSCQSFLVVAERPKMGLGLAIGAGVTNMLLDYIFIALFRWGVAGAAAATVCGYVVGGLVPLFYFLSKNKSPLRLVKAKPHLRMLGKSCTNGISELMTNVSASLVTVLYNRQLMAAAGQQGVAAYTVMMYVNFVFAAALIGFSMGSAPIFSYQYGADDKAGLQGMFKMCVKVILVLAVVMEVLAQLLGGTLSAIFVGYNDALREMTASGFHVFALAFLFNGMNIFGSAFFTALGDGLVSGRASL